MTVAVGRVVDDSIVVIENIKRRDTGPRPLTPADIVASVREVAGAVTASTLTTVAVFLPVAMVSGITGELFRPFAITVAIALVALAAGVDDRSCRCWRTGSCDRARSRLQPAGAGRLDR